MVNLKIQLKTYKVNKMNCWALGYKHLMEDNTVLKLYWIIASTEHPGHLPHIAQDPRAAATFNCPLDADRVKYYGTARNYWLPAIQFSKPQATLDL